MIEVDSPFPPGEIGYIYADNPPDFFYDSLNMTLVPKGTQLSKATGYNAAHNRNQIVDQMDGDWIWLLDCDHAWEPDALMRLLKRDVDAVLPLYSRRYAPFDPVVYKRFDPANDKSSELYTWAELSSETGLLSIAASGAGGLLVKRSALTKMEPPYFRVGEGNGPEWKNLLDKDGLHEDTGFGWRLRRAGCELFVDLDVSFGHPPVGAMLVPMRQQDGSFSVVANIGNHKVWLFKGEKQKRIHLA
jgi:cellulose synthase/poly-beta-1,6-N-acetylglucosamine synthase-like glycosyltransferase